MSNFDLMKAIADAAHAEGKRDDHVKTWYYNPKNKGVNVYTSKTKKAREWVATNKHHQDITKTYLSILGSCFLRDVQAAANGK